MAETVGSLIDKISITELKIYHMQEQIDRSDSDKTHREKCIQKHRILLEQRDDLAVELSDLCRSIFNGQKKLKVYRQFKMYNDPVYRSSSQSR